MNIMNKLTRKHMVTNRKRTLVTILGIIISVAMFTAVTTGTASVKSFFQRMEMEETGYWHVEYDNVTLETAEQIKKDSNTEYLSLSKELGYSLFPESTSELRHYLYFMSMDEKGFDMMNIEVISGRLPEKENEIIISKEMIKNSNKTYNIGDRLDVELGQRYCSHEVGETIELNQNDWYNTDEDGKPMEYWGSNGEVKKLIIVGIMKESGSDYAPGFPVISGLSKGTGVTYSAKVFLSEVSKDIYKESEVLAKKLDLGQVNHHNGLLKYYGVSVDESYNKMIDNLEIILICIIMVGSVSLIYNSFAISISERTKQFGMLSSVGTTKRQKMQAVLYEGFLCGCVSIPIGILAGMLGIGVTFWAINPMFQSALGREVPLELVVALQDILVAAVVSATTIIISAYLPARRASKITAMEAIRQQKDIKISKQSIKTIRLQRKIFGLEGDLALKNLKRNKKRYRVIVFSLGISIVLFISVSAYTHYLTAAVKLTSEINIGDIAIRDLSYEEAKTMLPSLKQLETLSDITVRHYSKANYQLSEEDSKWYATKEWLSDSGREDYNLDWMVIAIEDHTFEEFAKDSKIKLPKDSQAIPAIIINQQRDTIQYTITDSVPMKIEPNTLLTVNAVIYEETLANEAVVTQKTMDFNVIGTTKLLPFGMRYNSSVVEVQVIIPESRIEQLPKFLEDTDKVAVYTTIACNTSAPEKVTQQIETILDREVPKHRANILNFAQEVKASNQFVMVFNVFAYGFIILISLISIANMCNTIATSFAVRRREFAVLKSVGMTPGAFQKMIVFESVLYGIKALMLGLPLGMVFNYLIYKSVIDNFSTNYTIPYMTYIVAVISVFVVVGVAMLYSTSKTRKDNIIEGLKSEII